MDKQATAYKIEFNARRPLLGLTILLVEDSRYCSQAVRIMSVKSGARLRRADSLRSARRHLVIYRPDVLIVDLGLPDGSGVELIQELTDSPDWSPAIIALSGDDGGPGKAQALEVGATCFLTKPIQDLVYFQQVILSVTRNPGRPSLFPVPPTDQPVRMDRCAFFDDLRQMEKRLSRALPRADTKELCYLAQFAGSVAKTAQDHALVDCGSALAARLRGGARWQNGGERLLSMVRERLKEAEPI
ncbi:MAG: response regulator [Rhodobacteraceae bacterium]|nr:response regulator [Paracoccaceae bacterium]